MGTIHLKISIGDIWLPVDRVIPIALIINELVSNVLKHAFPSGRKGKIQIKLHYAQDKTVTPAVDTLRLSVADNGVGLPPGLDFDNLKTLGLKLVSNLTSQLGGKLSVDKSDGTNFIVEFPADSPLQRAKGGA